MRSLHRSRLSVSRGAPCLVGLAAVLLVAGCSGGADDADSGPPRLTPNPRYDVAQAMIESRPAPAERLNACELLDLTTTEIITLTGANMPEVEPTGSGDLGLICTYGGPGSPERAEAGEGWESWLDGENGENGEDADAETTTTSAGATTTESTTGATVTGTSTIGATTTRTTTVWDFDSDRVPDTFAAGVVAPVGGAEAALAGQPALLGARYACSNVRGSQAATVEGAPPAAVGAPAPTPPELDTAYIDCVASPAGGGVEVHTILVADDRLWHITLLRPEVPRTPESEGTALAGLHRVAGRILA